MRKTEMLGALEAILFACGEPIGVDKLGEALETDAETVLELSKALMEKFNTPQSGIQLLLLENDLQFTTNPAYIAPVRAALDLRRNTPLSQAAMEVLAVIAYNQPITKAFVEQVRGVDCSGVIGSLTLKGLIEERGRLELPGRPLLYGTTDGFLRCLGLSSLDELPPLPRDEAANTPDEEEAAETEALDEKGEAL